MPTYSTTVPYYHELGPWEPHVPARPCDVRLSAQRRFLHVVWLSKWAYDMGCQGIAARLQGGELLCVDVVAACDCACGRQAGSALAG